MNIRPNKSIVAWCVMLAGHLAPSMAGSISQQPLLNSKMPSPNIMLIFDDSASMTAEILPDSMAWPGNSSLLLMFPQTYASGTATDPSLYRGMSPGFGLPDTSVRPPWPILPVSIGFDPDIQVAQRRCSVLNRLYYDPEVTYRPWLNADGTEMAAADPSAAYWNPMMTTLTKAAINLKEKKTLTAFWQESNPKSGATKGTKATRDYYMGTYYTLSYTIDSATGGRVYADSNVLSSYTRYEITPTDASGVAKSFPKASTRTDCAGSVCTYDEEIQNFANWFQYYRSRILLARGAMGAALASQPSDSFRLGYALVADTGGENAVALDGNEKNNYLVKPIRPFGGDYRKDFMAELYGGKLTGGTGTNLRAALDAVGWYYEQTGVGSPWQSTPGTATSEKPLSCRRSYALMVTDGYWNKAAAANAAARQDVDSNKGPKIDRPNNVDNPWQYGPEAPYADGYPDTLADVAMYYWYRDLQPDLANLVQPTVSNEAFWQHMSTYIVGLGVDGKFNVNSDLAALVAGDKHWEPASSDSSNNIDDLWHATLNSRGNYFSAKNLAELKGAISSTLAEINAASGSTAGSISESRVYSDSSGIFYSIYDPTYWSGNLQYFRLKTTGSTNDTGVYWSASEQMPLPSKRSIFTKNSSGATVDFLWDQLSVDQQAALGNDSDVVNYLRGDNTWEVGTRSPTLANTDPNYAKYRFRTRRIQKNQFTNVSYTNVLGDILDSSVALVGNGDDYAYDALPATVPGQSTYLSAITTTFAKRKKMIYVGANDGMLHGFDAGTDRLDSDGHNSGGVEKFAYVPKALIPQLKSYATPGYSHRMYMDGPLEVGDAYLTIGGEARWRTILLGATGAGGKTIFAIDVTDPGSLGKSSVLWEHSASETGYEGLGYTISASRIGVINTEKKGHRWVAVVPNGYESASQGSGSDPTARAQLFILDLLDGSIIRVIDTNSGDATNPNGLGSVEVRVDDNRRIVAAYAGDKLGNFWKFDLSSGNPDEWKVAGATPASDTSDLKPKPIFSAAVTSGSTSVAQPITARPALWRLNSGKTAIVFGTGKLFEVGDGSSSLPSVQSIYAIVDGDRETTLGRSNLTALGSSGITNSAGDLVGVSITSEKVDLKIVDGWYLDIANLPGERVISQPAAIGGIAYITSFAPSSTVCEFGGSSILYAIDIGTGSATTLSQFVVNGNLFGSADCTGGSCLSGLKILGTTSGLSYLFRQTKDNTLGLTAVGASTSMQQINQSLGGSLQWRRGNWREIVQ